MQFYYQGTRFTNAHLQNKNHPVNLRNDILSMWSVRLTSTQTTFNLAYGIRTCKDQPL